VATDEANQVKDEQRGVLDQVQGGGQPPLHAAQLQGGARDVHAGAGAGRHRHPPHQPRPLPLQAAAVGARARGISLLSLFISNLHLVGDDYGPGILGTY
jgi:hypothetical protein